MMAAESQQEENQQTETAEAKDATETKGRPSDLSEDQGWDRVDFSPEQQKRFNRLYRQLKTQDEALVRMASEYKQVLDKLNAIDERQRTSLSEEKIDRLNSQLRAAIDNGDNERVISLTEDISNVKAAMLAEGNGKSPPENAQPQQPLLTPSQQARLTEWFYERDADGELLRPWALPGHQRHKEASEIATRVASDPALVAQGVDTILDHIDREMSRAGGNQRASVLSSSPAPRRSKSRDLSDAEKYIARKLGMKPEDYLKARDKYGANR